MLKLHRSLHIFLLATVLMFPLFVFQTAAAADPDLFISEIMAENNGPLVDEDGDESDWLELHNRGTDPLDLSGYYLTDDPLELDKWAFPAVTLNAGEYLLVFASDKNRDVGELHTNFSLKTEGEYLALVEPDGLTVVYEFSPAYAPQQKGLSYGTPDGTAVLGYFQTPTPAAANTTPYFEGIIGGVNFNYEHGFYDTPFNLVLDAIPADAVIRYTLDGSTPTESHGAIYTAALPITQTTFVRAIAYKTNYITTPVNTQTYLFLDDVAVQFADGLPPTPAWPSLFVSNDNYRVTGKNQLFNYGMDPDIVIDGEGDSGLYTVAEIKEALASISSISLVTDLENLVDPATGIYVNAGQRGGAWERPVSMELMFPDGTEGFQINAGLRIRGGYSRSDNNPKHAFRLFFSSDYGESKLRYPFFGDEGADEFDNLDLRTSQNYSWSFNNSNKNTFLREIFARDLMRDMGQPYTRSRYHHLYINGVYWGLYMSEERPEASFGETYFGGDKTEYDVIKSAGSSGGYNTEATDGDLNGDWKDLWDLGRAQNANPTLERYMQMQGLNPDGTRNPAYPVLLDEDNLIDYMIQIFYTGAFDNALSWYLTYAGVRDKGSNNWYGVRNRVTDDMGFQFFAHDGEHSLGVQYSPGQDLADTRSNRVGPFHEADQQGIFSGSNPQYLHQDLMYTEEYAVAFGDRVHKYFFNDGILTPDAVYNRIEPRRQVVDAVIMAEAARWGDSKRVTPYDKSTWLNEVNRMYYYLLYDGGNPVRVNRTVEVLNQLIAVGLYPSVEAPTYNQHGGLVAPNFNLTMTTFPTGTVYYTLDGSDPRLLGGAINPEALVYNGGNVVLTNDVTVKARQWTGSEWSALNEADFIINNAVPADGTNLVISEIHYNPADEDDDWEFLEFKNIGAEKLDLAGVTVSGAVTFVFPELTLLQPGEHLLIVEDEIAFNSRYATNTLSPWYYDGLAVVGAWTGSLSNGGEEIIVTAADLSLILQFAYDDSGAWPSRADGYGSGVELTDPTAVPSTQPERNIYLADGNHWRPTSEYHGSPGRDGLGPDNRVVVNEILSNSLTISDTIELYNTIPETVPVGGWFLSDDRDNYKKYRIPAGTNLAAAGFYTVSAVAFGDINDPNSFEPFGLSSTDGDDLYLLQADNLGNLKRFVDHVEFGATALETTVGRLPDGQGDLYRLCAETLGQSNTADGNKVCYGPVVINEIHYNPDGTDDNLEFIELYNFGDNTESLANWRLRGEVDYNFGAGISLAPEEALLIVGFDPANTGLLDAFRAAFKVDEAVAIVGPWTPSAAKLDDGGATIKLYRAGELVVPAVEPPYYAMLTEDIVAYDDEADWPLAPDGAGPSLELISPALDNRLGSSWEASLTSKGTAGRHNDDDFPAISMTNAAATENPLAATATFTVALEHASGMTVTVEYATADDTATAGIDYTAAMGTVEFAPGQTEQTIVIDVLDDERFEGNESFLLNLSNPAHGYLLNNQALGLISDDDAAPVIYISDVAVGEGNTGTLMAMVAVTLTNPSTAEVTVDYATADGDALAGADYTAASGTITFTAGTTSQTIMIPVQGDITDEPNETFEILLSNPAGAAIGTAAASVTILDDDDTPQLSLNDVSVVEGAAGTQTTAVISVTLSNPSSEAITAVYTTTAGTATADSDYQAVVGTLTIDPGLMHTAITVTIVGDELDEVDETFFVEIGNVTNGELADEMATVTIVDDEGVPTFSITDVAVTEGDSGAQTAVLTVNLLPASEETLTVDYATADGDALAGEDYTAASGQLTFTAGTTSQTITITITGDELDEADETFTVNLSNASGGALLSDAQAVVTITNDDSGLFVITLPVIVRP